MEMEREIYSHINETKQNKKNHIKNKLFDSWDNRLAIEEKCEICLKSHTKINPKVITVLE